MQLPKARAQRSVGEKDAPLPALSVGASVIKRTPLGVCSLSTRKSPR